MNENEEKFKKIRLTGKKVKSRGILRLIFGRGTIFGVALLLQIYVMLAFLYQLSDTREIYMLLVCLSLVTVVYIVNTDSNSNFKLAWIIPILVFPVFGAAFFLYIHSQLGTIKLRKRSIKIENLAVSEIKQEPTAFANMCEKSDGERDLARYFWKAGGLPVYENSAVKFFPLGEKKVAQLVKELEKAERFIFLEYFIIAEGDVWNEVLSVLKQKADEGVEVRILYDGTSSLTCLPLGYFKRLRKMGFQARAFSPVRPVLTTYQNNRDHRKIVVIDGKTAFTGGVNLADEYANKIIRFGHWKDTAVMVKGDACRNFTYMFLKMWALAGKEDHVKKSEIAQYINSSQNLLTKKDRLACMADSKIHSGGFVVPYADNPYGKERIGKQVYMDILYRAHDYCHIMTPYLILDDEMISALRFAAQRGVEVSIIMPHIPDKKMIYSFARTYYPMLIGYGVRIFEYMPGFVHAKEFVSDNERAVVGTINLDYRSLYLHFENGCYIYSNPVIADVEKDFQETLEYCREITMENVNDYPKLWLLGAKFLKYLAPLL